MSRAVKGARAPWRRESKGGKRSERRVGAARQPAAAAPGRLLAVVRAALLSAWTVACGGAEVPLHMGLGEPGVPAYLNEAIVRRHLGERWTTSTYDPWALIVPRPNQSRWGYLRDHPGGRYLIETNERGLVGSRATLDRASGRRVLVGGDSHTQAATSFETSFPRLAEANLRAQGVDVEILNAGAAYTSPRSYFGRLLTCLELGVDDYVAVLYLGNDFWEDFQFACLHRTGQGPGRVGGEYRVRLNAAAAAKSGPLWQGLNQAYRFKHRPQEAELALNAVKDSLEALASACGQLDLAFTVMLLPSKPAVEPEADAEDFAQLCAQLELTPEEAALEQVLAARLMQWMDERSLPYLDLLPVLRSARGAEPLYWQDDYHLSIAGNRVVARALVDVLAAHESR